MLKFNFKKTIKKANLIVQFLNRTKVKTTTNKVLKNSQFVYDFKGFTKLNSAAESTFKALSSVGPQAARATVTAGAGALTISALFSNSLSCLSKLIQIIEFSCLLELYNFDYDPTLGQFLNKLNEMTKFDLIPMPLNKLASRVSNSKAGPWAGKLSKVDTKPYLLQEVGYPGLLLIVRNTLFFPLIEKQNFEIL